MSGGPHVPFLLREDVSSAGRQPAGLTFLTGGTEEDIRKWEPE